MRIDKFKTLGEKVAYINGLLNAAGSLNTTADNMMAFYFVELHLIDNDFESSLKEFLETPNWVFTLNRLEDWESHFKSSSKFFFTNILRDILGSSYYQDIYNLNTEKFDQSAERFNLIEIFDELVYSISNILAMYEDPQVYSVNIDSRADPYAGYFAHCEENYIFKVAENKMLFLHLSAAD